MNSSARNLAGLTIFLALLLAFVAATPADAGTFLTENYNGRVYKVFIPDGYTPGAPTPLVVLLHGCAQNADNFANATKMNTYADARTFIAVYPQQASANNTLKCWNWFLPAHQARGGGEPAEIAGIVAEVKSAYTIDDSQVYVFGFSAGGAMAAIMGATYPDVFAGVGVHSGMEYKAATSQIGGFLAMANGGPNPDVQGVVAYNAMGPYARRLPTMVFHGTADFTVNPVNGSQVISQWAQTNDLADDGADDNNVDDAPEQSIPGNVPGGRSYMRLIYEDNAGQTVLEKYEVSGMGHNWSGGLAGGSFTDPQGPDASAILLDFFLNEDGGDDEIPPVTSANPPGGVYTGAVSVTLSANEPATTYYKLGEEGSVLPYTAPIPITATATLYFRSVDDAGNIEALRQETYTINDLPPGADVFSSIPAEDGYVSLILTDGKSETVHKLGDKGMFNSDSFRVILSFDTSSLPDNATVTGATLRFYRQSQTGVVNSVTLDISNGAFGAPGLEFGDYYAAASASNIASVAPPLVDDGFVDVALPAAALPHINVAGRTQFRLKASTPLNFASDVLTLHGGESLLFAPTLTITYTE
ncbi:MAG: hypothetical protein Fur0021_22600 [Candidatus Promineifilaceae bacterium]